MLLIYIVLSLINGVLIRGIHFSGHYDKCVSALREKHKEDMAAVTCTIFSHNQVYFVFLYLL